MRLGVILDCIMDDDFSLGKFSCEKWLTMDGPLMKSGDDAL